MKFNYKLHRLCGASYGTPSATGSNQLSSTSKGSNIVFTRDGNSVLSPVANRVQVLDLLQHSCRTLPVEARSNIRRIALSPDDRLLIIVDVNHHAMLINYHRGVVLHRFKFKKPVRVMCFSPNGAKFAVSFGKLVQVWHTPGIRREFAPMILHRKYSGLVGDVTTLDWSSDSTVLLAGGKDCQARVWTVDTVKDYQPWTLVGHKKALIGVHFESRDKTLAERDQFFGGTGNTGSTLTGKLMARCYTVSQDGVICTRECRRQDEDGGDQDDEPSGLGSLGNSAVDFFSGGKSGAASSLPAECEVDQAHDLVNCRWGTTSRHYFSANSSTQDVVSTSYSTEHSLLVVGFSTGLFGLYELPSMSNIHTLSLSNSTIGTVSINPSAEWLAFGCPKTQQLLIWEWRSETYILKQSGHAYGMRCLAYSPDGTVVATGGEDGTIKLWNSQSGFCYVTMPKTHTAACTAVEFANPTVVLSASLDGTVRAHDLHRYRNFKTYTSDIPCQFISMAVDKSGEVVCAGSAEPFRICVWSVQTGKLTDVLSGHMGPVSGLAFHPVRGTLASSSWDGEYKEAARVSCETSSLIVDSLSKALARFGIYTRVIRHRRHLKTRLMLCASHFDRMAIKSARALFVVC